jgi:hypothetical protein
MNAVNMPRRNTVRIAGIGTLLVVLASITVYAGMHELGKQAPATSPVAHAFTDQRPALSAQEERFAQAAWNIHADVRTAAVRMTFAGLAFKMGDGDAANIRDKVAPLTDVFRGAGSALQALDTPASMRPVRDRYAEALQLFGAASQEMVRIAQDGDESHLLKAQEMSERAADILLDVGEQLWPGEIKPN